MTTNAINNATDADLKAALAYLGVMREQCLNEDGDEIAGSVTAAMLVASAKLPSSQFAVLVELVSETRETGFWYFEDSSTGEHGVTDDGSVWYWTINAESREGEAHSLTIEKEADAYGVYLHISGPRADDGTRTISTLAQARIYRADLIALLAAE